MTWRVAVNALSISAMPSGGRTYLLNLFEELADLAGDEFHFDLLVSRQLTPLLAERLRARSVRLVAFPTWLLNPVARVLVEQLVLPSWLAWNRDDLLFAARNVAPLLSLCPVVIGIHSMHLNYGQTRLPWWRRLYARLVLETSARRAAAYVAVSEFAGKSFLQRFNLPADRLYIAPNGFRTSDSPPDGQELPIGLGPDYLLFVGTLFPHKNVAFLLRAFACLTEQRPGTLLVVVGRDVGGALSELEALAESLGVSDRVRFLGDVSDSTLVALYAHARAFAFPSLVEGFGLPVLEAMGHGLPVVVSNRTSLPEVVGDAGCLLEPEDPGAWAASLLRVLDDDELRQSLGRRAAARARQFTWRRSAEVTLDCFRFVLER